MVPFILNCGCPIEQGKEDLIKICTEVKTYG
jgi:hypothetical protein